MTASSFTALPGRLDKALTQLVDSQSRARLQALIKEGNLKVNGKAITSPAHILKGGEELMLTVPEAIEAAPQGADIPLDIIFEDKDLLVINKPAGLVVHPAAGHHNDTLVNALIHHCGKSLSGIGGEKRPGIVHRLDKDTSGLLVVAKNDAAHRGLTEQFSGHNLSRIYIAFAWGLPKEAEGTIEGIIGRSGANRKKMAVVHPKNYKDDEPSMGSNFYGYRGTKQRRTTGKHAVTHYTVDEVFGGLAARYICELETGRTHQIRVHLSSIGHSVIGDPLYGKASGMKQHLALKKLKDDQRDYIVDFPRQALHAAELSFTHPVSGKKRHFTAPLPDDMKKLAKYLALVNKVK
jgi:23S rRNA pseudouridine1911/1915/1917 synthase